MSRNPEGRQFKHTQQYQKAHIFEEIQELYKIACLTYGYSPIKFVRPVKRADDYNNDYGLCAEVIAAAKKVTDAGGGKIAFSSSERELENGGYSYRVYKSRNRNGSNSDSCGRIDWGADACCSRI